MHFQIFQALGSFRMLFLLFGASAAGKTSTIAHLRGSLDAADVHDFDEIGVPHRPTLEWRHAANEHWLWRASAAHERRMDLLVAAQTPLGEMLAATSALAVPVSGCLLDCDDKTRLSRIHARGAVWLERAGGTVDDHIAWGRWMRGHATDPAHRREVIKRDDGQFWDRLSLRSVADRWPIRVIDTTQPVENVARLVIDWVAREQVRRAARPGLHSLDAEPPPSGVG